MKRLLAIVLAAGMAVVSMAGCGGGGDDKNSCADACRKMGDCNLLPAGINVDRCTAECEDRLRVEEGATQGDIDCILEHDCGDIFDSCSGGGYGGGGGALCSDIMQCPGGGGMIGFCVVGGGTSCYYTLGGRQYQCASCNDLLGCAQAVVNACGR